MKRTKKLALILCVVLSISLNSCKKYLDAKSDKSLSTLTTSQDLQSLLDHYIYVNYQDPGSAEVNADSYYMGEHLDYLSTEEFNQYVWANQDIYTPPQNDWSNIYDVIYRANTVLDNIDKVQFDLVNKQDNYNNLKGQALFLRARSFLQAMDIWALAYDSTTADTEPGIPLRLNSDFNQKSTRSTIKQAFEQIIADLKSASELLPTTPLHVFRASKPAALALIARTYLAAGDFNSTLKYADSCLQLKNGLFDFNDADTASLVSIPLFNPEVLFEAGAPFPTTLIFGDVDTTLYSLYDTNDLRKATYFLNNGDGTYSFKSGYSTANGYLFDGIATDEVYLMRAEANARLGYTVPAMNDINLLLSKRYVTGSYQSQTASTNVKALDIVLLERRKELYFRNLRWMDIKRLNRISPDISLKRIANNKTYLLPAGSKRFANPLPDDIVQLSGMQQNAF